jgi:hypothetical protein
MFICDSFPQCHFHPRILQLIKNLIIMYQIPLVNNIYNEVVDRMCQACSCDVGFTVLHAYTWPTIYSSYILKDSLVSKLAA